MVVEDQNKNASDLLSSLAGGDFKEIRKIIKFIKEGYKLDNFAMRQLIEVLRKEKNYSDTELLETYLELDEAVEKGLLNNGVIEYIKANPDTIARSGK